MICILAALVTFMFLSVAIGPFIIAIVCKSFIGAIFAVLWAISCFVGISFIDDINS